MKSYIEQKLDEINNLLYQHVLNCALYGLVFRVQDGTAFVNTDGEGKTLTLDDKYDLLVMYRENGNTFTPQGTYGKKKKYSRDTSISMIIQRKPNVSRDTIFSVLSSVSQVTVQSDDLDGREIARREFDLTDWDFRNDIFVINFVLSDPSTSFCLDPCAKPSLT
jgi:hypothetical protein